jgi:predicted DNA-binding mobile mystery protein A
MVKMSKAPARRQARRALDLKFSTNRNALENFAEAPHAGWIRAIREAIGMSAADLATRMNVVDSTVTRLEIGEARGRAQLNSLRRAANALDCDFIYVLVPRKPLNQQVKEQARRRAEKDFDRVKHTMALEDQVAPIALANELLEEHISSWIDRPGLWSESQTFEI